MAWELGLCQESVSARIIFSYFIHGVKWAKIHLLFFFLSLPPSTRCLFLIYTQWTGHNKQHSEGWILSFFWPYLLSLSGSQHTYLSCFPVVMPLNGTSVEMAWGQSLPPFFFLNIRFIGQYEFWYVRLGKVNSKLISKKKQHKNMFRTLEY